LDRTEKEKTASFLHERFLESRFISLAEFHGMDVAEISALRHELRSTGTELRVVKNSIAKRAIQDTSLEILHSHFVGSTAVALSAGDPVASAKVLSRFSKENPKLKIKVGFLEGKEFPPEDLSELAKLPPREILLARLLGVLQGPPTGLVNVLAAVLRKFLGTLQAIEQQKSK
jgi:large subunit ribosomal protein L10